MQSLQLEHTVVLPTSKSNSYGSPLGKPMSISSILTMPHMNVSSSSLTHKLYHKETMERRASAPSHPYHHPQKYPSAGLIRSPPTTPEERMFEASIPSSPSSSTSSISSQKPSFHSTQSYYQQNSRHSSNFEGEDEDIDDLDMAHPPLTLQERRLRNKAASAKYRQKKNQQQNEMRLMIGRLSEQNAVLERQLQELRLENDRLKTTADKLRGKMVAKKMLKKWIGRQAVEGNDNKKNIDFVYNQKEFQRNYSYTNTILGYSAGSGNDYSDNVNTVVADILSSQSEDDQLDTMSSD
ncbi:hypothetical protein BD560DRAFT_405142 [Blakeslea trispora]|nr:hypothetical protein BD560DRAFT_405142 [Blakeslea trispora]